MPSPRPPRLRSRRVRLRTLSPLERTAAPDHPDPVLGWLPASIGGGLLAALAGWVLVTGLTVVGWLPGAVGDLDQAMVLGTRFWQLAHGAGVPMAEAVWTLVPLGISLVVFVCVRSAAAFAAHQALLAEAARDAAAATDDRIRVRLGARTGGVVLGCYLVPLLMSLLLVPAVDVGRAVLGSLLITLPAVAWGVVNGTQLDPVARLPRWAQPVPRAVLAAQLVVVVGAAAALTVTLLQNAERVTSLGSSLGGGAPGAIALVALQLGYLPTLLIWSASFVLGPGFSVGTGTVVSLSDTQLGLLPAVPVLGALPPEGPGEPVELLWLLVGVAAGAVAAATVMRARPRARFDETALVGGLAGTVSGLVTTGLAVLARGDLGSNRLTGLGPDLLGLVVIAPALLGVSGMLVGLAWGLVRRPRPDAD
ncbi:DUF6350 family protein [Propionibacteriaceae bacterium Y2011]|uniref:cell division protein PerM n=1 Tax=Microlunatus sp. Y2014 TaxID=3418488 RepID=UPI003B4E8359